MSKYNFGYTFDNEMREELMEAALAYQKDNQARTKLNAVIMKIQQPLIDKLEAIAEALES